MDKSNIETVFSEMRKHGGDRLFIKHNGRELAANVLCLPSDDATDAKSQAGDISDEKLVASLKKADARVLVTNLEDGNTGEPVELTASIQVALKREFIKEFLRNRQE